MKKIIFAVVCFCVALMPSRIQGSLKVRLKNMAEHNQTINRVFRPSQNGYAGKSTDCVMFKGTLLLSTDVKVLMKFTHTNARNSAIQEYVAYSCLNAIDNATVEEYGIPSVRYYGSWEEYTLLAITLPDFGFKKLSKTHRYTEIEYLMICREFMRISKYIHSRGIVHNAPNTENIMFRNNRVFLTGFGAATMFYVDDAWPESPGAKEIDATRMDWHFFVHSIYTSVTDNRMKSFPVFNVISKIAGLGPFYHQLNYDLLYGDIDGEINRLKHNEPAYFSWLTPDQMAMDEPISPIDSINQPFNRVKFRYPEVNYSYFDRVGRSSGGSTSVD